MEADDPTRTGIPLEGGNVSHGVVRIGQTVRRPAGPWSPAVDAFLRHLNQVGFTAAPRSLGFDEQGRHVLEYVHGEVAMPVDAAGGPGLPRRAGALIRDFHDASAEYEPPVGAIWNVLIPPDSQDLVIHHDLGPWNLICSPSRWAFIDWDNAGPGSRLWDLAYAAHGFVPLDPATPPAAAGERLAALVSGYGLREPERERLVALLPRRAMSMHEMLARGRASGTQPWASLWSLGHGRLWRAKAEYATDHREFLAAACR